jgi:magnesium-transporting ATPase (P-type)
VDTAADVAKDAADVVLLEKDLGVLAAGVAEGRRIFANTIKYVLMGTSSNFGNMFSAAAASAVLTFLPMLPSQILLNNLLYDSSQLAIPTDRVDESSCAALTLEHRFIRRFMLYFGPFLPCSTSPPSRSAWVFHRARTVPHRLVRGILATRRSSSPSAPGAYRSFVATPASH